MVLEPERARTFNCEECDYNLQIKRNCSNQYDESKIVLNQELYKQCPRSIIFNQRELRFLVDLYFECKENKNYPLPGSIFNQTAFTIELFDYIDGIVNKYRDRKFQEQKNKTQTDLLKKTKK